jgi:hypothetical protein
MNILMKLEHSRQIFEKKFMKICPVRAELYGRMDKDEKADSCFTQFCERDSELPRMRDVLSAICSQYVRRHCGQQQHVCVVSSQSCYLPPVLL